MALPGFDLLEHASHFTTGSSALPDIGELYYNGCIFSPFFISTLTGTFVKDEAKRTVKYTEIVLTVDGYVTLKDFGPGLENDINPTMQTLHRLLIAQGGELIYEGRGWDIYVDGGGAGGGVLPPNAVINPSPGAILGTSVGPNADLAWGPVPEVLEFQPLGGGLSAKVKWRVTIHVYPSKAGKKTNPLLQFNFETSVSYGEDCFSTLSMRGMLEIPMSRPAQGTRTLTQTADGYRSVLEARFLKGIDLSRFRITRREFATSRDKRTLTWDFALEEKPYMDLPPNCPVARGTFTVRPVKLGPALASWLCTLRATYTTHPDVPRRQAHLLFMALLRLRMSESSKGVIPPLPAKEPPPAPNIPAKVGNFLLNSLKNTTLGRTFFPVTGADAGAEVEKVGVPILLDFNLSEGLYLDSKTITFSATWRLNTDFSRILMASGTWAKLNERTANGGNLWATSMADVLGTQGYLRNRLDPSLDVIVDFGSTD